MHEHQKRCLTAALAAAGLTASTIEAAETSSGEIPSQIDDINAILAVEKLYEEGCAEGGGEKMRPAFAAAATINGEPIEKLFADVTKAGPAKCRSRVDVLGLYGTCAAVRVVLENYHGSSYVDFHVLHKGRDGWKIAAKVFA